MEEITLKPIFERANDSQMLDFPHAASKITISSVYGFRLMVGMASLSKGTIRFMIEAETKLVKPDVPQVLKASHLKVLDMDEDCVTMSCAEYSCDIFVVIKQPVELPAKKNKIFFTAATFALSSRALSVFLSRVPTNSLLHIESKMSLEQPAVVTMRYKDRSGIENTLCILDSEMTKPRIEKRTFPSFGAMSFEHVVRAKVSTLTSFAQLSKTLNVEKISFETKSLDFVTLVLKGDLGVFSRKFAAAKQGDKKSNPQKKNITPFSVSIAWNHFKRFLKHLNKESFVDINISPQNPLVLFAHLGHDGKHSHVKHVITTL